MNEMRARGFEDAFVVTYKDGERINLNTAISQEKSQYKAPKENKVIEVKKPKIQIVIQLGIFKEKLSPNILAKMAAIGNIDKEKIGSDLYKYSTVAPSFIIDARNRLSEIKIVGFSDAFLLFKKDGKRITIDEAEKFLE